MTPPETTKTVRLALGRRQAAEALGISIETLSRLVKRKMIFPSVATRRPLFPVAELERFLRDTTVSINT